MTNWLPELQKTNNPLYVELADTIERDIDSGKLKPGTKLPPQRNIAFDIGVTVGTISRGYALACERGLVSGEIGRGTYVLEREEAKSPSTDYFLSFASKRERAIEKNHANENKILNLVHSTAINVGQPNIIAEISAKIATDSPFMVTEYIPDTPTHWKEAGQEWLSIADWTPDIESIVPTNGAQAAINAVVAALTVAGDKIVFEGLSYSPAARSIELMGRRVILAEFDEDGLIPESFESICAQQHPKILYLMPSAHNPTLARLSEARRQAIADIAHRYNVLIIEDCIYASVVGDTYKPISYYAPDRSFYIGGLSKSMAAGLRAGWISCPPQFTTRIRNAHNRCMGASSYWLGEVAARLVNDGEAEKIRNKIRTGISERTSIVAGILANYDFETREHCPFTWLRLPEPWNAGMFQNAVANYGILISDEDDFKPKRSGKVYYAVRMALTSVPKPEDLIKPFEEMRDILDSEAFANINKS